MLLTLAILLESIPSQNWLQILAESKYVQMSDSLRYPDSSSA